MDDSDFSLLMAELNEKIHAGTREAVAALQNDQKETECSLAVFSAAIRVLLATNSAAADALNKAAPVHVAAMPELVREDLRAAYKSRLGIET